MTNRRTITITEELHGRLLEFIEAASEEMALNLPAVAEAVALGDALAEADGNMPICPSPEPEPTGYHTDVYINHSLSHHERLPFLPELGSGYRIGEHLFSVVGAWMCNDNGTTLAVYLAGDAEGDEPKGRN